MEKFLIRNEECSSPLNQISFDLDSSHTQSILESYQESVSPPSKKRKCIDRIIVSSNEKIRRTKNNYFSSSLLQTDKDFSSIYGSLSESQIVTYTNFT